MNIEYRMMNYKKVSAFTSKFNIQYSIFDIL